MAGMRICAILSVGALAAYHVTRVLASRCSGPRCDVYVGNVLIFALAVIFAVLTGVLGIAAARQRRQGTWVGLLAGCTLVALLVPTLGLVLFRNSPDTFIASSTTVTVLVPLVTLVYSFVPPRLRERA